MLSLSLSLRRIGKRWKRKESTIVRCALVGSTFVRFKIEPTNDNFQSSKSLANLRTMKRERARIYIRCIGGLKSSTERAKLVREETYERAKPCQRTHRIILSNPPAPTSIVVPRIFFWPCHLAGFLRGQVDYISDRFVSPVHVSSYPALSCPLVPSWAPLVLL